VSGVSTDYGNPACTHTEEGQVEHSGQAQRSGQAKRSGKGGSGVSPGYGTTQHANTQEKNKRSGQTERSGEGAAIHIARTPKKAKPSTAARPSAAEKGCLWVSPDYDKTQNAPNAAARPG